MVKIEILVSNYIDNEKVKNAISKLIKFINNYTIIEFWFEYNIIKNKNRLIIM